MLDVFLTSAMAFQKTSHRHGDIAKINIDWAGVETFMTHRAMLSDIIKFLKVFYGDSSARLLLVQKRFDEE